MKTWDKILKFMTKGTAYIKTRVGNLVIQPAGGTTTVNSNLTVQNGKTLTTNTVDINGGAIDGTNIGASSAGTGKFTTLETTDNVTIASGKGILRSRLAGENLAFGQPVVLLPADVEDLMNSYADQAAIQAVYVDSDASNKMVDIETTNFATGSQALKLLAVATANTGDSVAKTISSKDFTGLTVHLLIRASATDGDWEFRLGTGNLTTDYFKKALTVSSTNTYEHISFTVASMTAAGGSEDITAITRVGFYCVDDTGGPSLLIDRIWYTSGTDDYVVKKADASNWDLLPVDGIATATITSGSSGNICESGELAGFTGLVPGAKYYVSDTAGELVVAAVEATKDVYVGRAISETILLIEPNGSVS